MTYDREKQQTVIDRMREMWTGGKIGTNYPASKHAPGRKGKPTGQKRKK